MKVLDGRLGQAEYLAGNDYSIADIANFGWIWRREFAGIDFEETPHVARWYGAIEARPATTRAVTKLAS